MRKGFSLLELLVVIAIIGILAAVGIVGYQGYIEGTKKETALSNHARVNRAFTQDFIAIVNELGGPSMVGSESSEGGEVLRTDTCLKYVDKAVSNLNTDFENAYDPELDYAVNLHHEAYAASTTSPSRPAGLEVGQLGLLCADACAPISSVDYFMLRCTCTNADGCELHDATNPVHDVFWPDLDSNGVPDRGYIGPQLAPGVCPVPEPVQAGLDCTS